MLNTDNWCMITVWHEISEEPQEALRPKVASEGEACAVVSIRVSGVSAEPDCLRDCKGVSID